MTRDTAAPDAHADMVRAIMATYYRASDAQCRAGRDWYGAARAIVDAIAGWSGMPPDRIAGAVAALSPRNPWAWNVADAAVFARAAAEGAPMPGASTFGANRRTAWAMLTAPDGAADWYGDARKVRAFVRAIMGDRWAVVVDVWAIRVATDGARSVVRSSADYDAVAAAYVTASRMLAGDDIRVTPRDLQAITWIVAQSDGTGSRRRGRHTLTLKRGTPAVIVTALTGQLCLWP